jgi:uncharacterized membrane protein
MTVRHAAGMVVVGVVAVIIAIAVLHAIAGIVLFFVEVAIAVAFIAGIFWIFGRLRR